MVLVGHYDRIADLSLILAWPIMGAGTGGGDRRVAMSLAVRVDVAATVVAVAKPEGTFR